MFNAAGADGRFAQQAQCLCVLYATQSNTTINMPPLALKEQHAFQFDRLRFQWQSTQENSNLSGARCKISY